MIVVVPATSPVTSPVLPIVAMAGSELAHVPPKGVEDKTELEPTQRDSTPEMGVGNGLTVTIVV